MDAYDMILDKMGNKLQRYTGLDVACKEIARHNHVFHQRPSWNFFCVDVCKQSLLPGYDLIFTRDALQHLPMNMAIEFLRNVKNSGAKWLLLGSYIHEHDNRDINIGDYYSINLLDAPFSCNLPQETFSELSEEREKKFMLLYDVSKMECGCLKDGSKASQAEIA